MNSHENNKLVVFDDHENIAIVEDGMMSIQGERYIYNVPVAEGLVSFIDLDFDEMGYAEDGIEPLDHPFLEMFPPEYDGDMEVVYEECRDYYSFLQTKFFLLVTFCFDQGFHAGELGDMTAEQRLYVYAKTKGGDVPQEIKQMYLFDPAVVEDFKKAKKTTPLEAAFGIPAGYIEHIKNKDAKMMVQYGLSSTYDALSLAFYQMIAMNLKLKRCKNCDKYFLVKSKRNTDYCDRLASGTTQTCQQLAAVKRFAKKNEKNLPYQTFTLYYKRYHERKKVGTIKPEVFDKWNLEACTMRNKCMDGECTLEEFTEWCKASFPNRPEKPKP